MVGRYIYTLPLPENETRSLEIDSRYKKSPKAPQPLADINYWSLMLNNIYECFTFTLYEFLQCIWHTHDTRYDPNSGPVVGRLCPICSLVATLSSIQYAKFALSLFSFWKSCQPSFRQGFLCCNKYHSSYGLYCHREKFYRLLVSDREGKVCEWPTQS